MFQGNKNGFGVIHFLASITIKHWELPLVVTKQENCCEQLFTELLSNMSIISYKCLEDFRSVYLKSKQLENSDYPFYSYVFIGEKYF